MDNQGTYIVASVFRGGAFDEERTRKLALRVMVLATLTALFTIAATVVDLSDGERNDAIVAELVNKTGEGEGQVRFLFFANAIFYLLLGLSIPVLGFLGAKRSNEGQLSFFSSASAVCSLCTWCGVIGAFVTIGSVGSIACSEYAELGLNPGSCIAKLVILIFLAILYSVNAFLGNKLKKEVYDMDVVTTSSFKPSTVVTSPYTFAGNNTSPQIVQAYPTNSIQSSYPASNSAQSGYSPAYSVQSNTASVQSGYPASGYSKKSANSSTTRGSKNSSRSHSHRTQNTSTSHNPKYVSKNSSNAKTVRTVFDV